MDGLLAQARSRNESLGLTGVLCTGRGYFVQALEGFEEVVLPMYARIIKDTRHQDCALLSVGLVAARVFPTWTMAHVDGDVLGRDLHQRLLSEVVLERDLSEPLNLLKGALKALRRAA